MLDNVKERLCLLSFTDINKLNVLVQRNATELLITHKIYVSLSFRLNGGHLSYIDECI